IRAFYLISTTAERITAGVIYAADQGVDILNASYSSTIDDPNIRAAFGYALNKGVIVVAAVGNAGPYPNSVMYPALYDGIIGVGGLQNWHDSGDPPDNWVRIGEYSSRGEN